MPERILVIRLDNIGDVIMLSPALRALKEARPKSYITLMASPAGAQAAQLLPWVNDVRVWRSVWQEIDQKRQHQPETEMELVDQLKAGGYDAAYIFTSYSQSPYPPAYACFLAGIPARIGQSREFGGLLLTDWVRPLADEEYQVDRNLNLLKSTGIPVTSNHLELRLPDSSQQEVDEILSRIGIRAGEPYILLAPGASAAARRYDPGRYLQTALILIEKTLLPVLLVGTERDKEHMQGLQLNQHPLLHDLLGQTSLANMAGLISRSVLVLCNNSAALHMAEAFFTPVVSLYAGTDIPTQWAPRYTPHRLLYQPVACSPCGFFTCPYHHECLDVSTEDVASACMEMIVSTNAQPVRDYPSQSIQNMR